MIIEITFSFLLTIMIAPRAEVEEFPSLKSDHMDRDFKLGNPLK